jgi:pyrimidine deaminase RibD-like protein
MMACSSRAASQRMYSTLRRALDLAALGLGRTRPDPAVGCVVLDADGEVRPIYLLTVIDPVS